MACVLRCTRPQLIVGWDLGSAVNQKTHTWPLPVAEFGLSHSVAAGFQQDVSLEGKVVVLGIVGFGLRKSPGVTLGIVEWEVLCVQLWKVGLPLLWIFCFLHCNCFCPTQFAFHPQKFLLSMGSCPGRRVWLHWMQKFTEARLFQTIEALPWPSLAFGLGDFSHCDCSPL